jgi:Amidases related to nicotinamidase
MGTTTLLLIDIDSGVLNMLLNPAKSSELAAYMDTIKPTVQAARQKNIKIIHIISASRPELLDPVLLAQSKSNGDFPYSALMHATIKPALGELVIAKNHYSSFMGTFLGDTLRGTDTDRVLIAGSETSGSVLSTICHTRDLGLKITILSDLLLDTDEELHWLLIEGVFGKMADVITAKGWVDRLNAASAVEA